MDEPFVTGVGAVLSADIAAPEHERLRRFYGRALATGQQPLWRDDLMNNLGTPVIGIGARSAETAHLPVQWMPHIQVADVNASVQRALDLGGSVLMRAEGHGGWAVLRDPAGAAFGIIPVVPADAIPRAARGTPVGRIAWADLTVPDAPAVRDFYRQVVGWSAQDVPMKDAGDSYADYNMLGESGSPVAGICHARGVNASLPPVWMIYLAVGDLAESLRRVEEDGGRVIKTVRGKDGSHVCGAVQDPAGAYVSLVPGQW